MKTSYNPDINLFQFHQLKYLNSNNTRLLKQLHNLILVVLLIVPASVLTGGFRMKFPHVQHDVVPLLGAIAAIPALVLLFLAAFVLLVAFHRVDGLVFPRTIDARCRFVGA